MMAVPVIVIFDVGKTNKKVFVFNEDYEIVYERSARFTETYDEDGDVCENLESLRSSVFNALHELLARKDFMVRAVNFSGYGASLVFTDESGKPLTPLYNYLKSYPLDLQNEFDKKYGQGDRIAAETSSPALGSLNSGMQLYRVKNERPALFNKIRYALHLPQYLSFMVTGQAVSGLTSIGCHTRLWDFGKQNYHPWVIEEELDKKLAPLMTEDQAFDVELDGHSFKAGPGLHDSSAALIPYLINFHEPFILISTGTWCITMNPFREEVLTAQELDQDCLCYLQYKGKAVAASRIFAGYEHEQQVKRIAEHFNEHTGFYRGFHLNAELAERIFQENAEKTENLKWSKTSGFDKKMLNRFKTAEEAYYYFILDIVKQQFVSSRLVMKSKQLKRIFVDGGFSKNQIYMNFLARFFSEMEVYAASMAQASAIGAALAIHEHWNTQPIPDHIIELKYYAGKIPFKPTHL